MNKMIAFSVGLSCLLAANVVWAGRTSSGPVTIDTANRVASGALGTARNIADPTQLLTCETEGLSSAVFGFCFAVVGNSVASCSTTAPNLVQAIETISGDSDVQFVWDPSGSCTSIISVQSSALEPKR